MSDPKALPANAKVLAASEHLVLYGLWEAAYVWTGTAHLYVGDQYGDPQCGLIDWNERWCLTGGGSGLIVCPLAGWPAYAGEVDLSATWRQVRRFADGQEVWPVHMAQVEETTVRFVQDLCTDAVGIYDLDIDTLTMRKL